MEKQKQIVKVESKGWVVYLFADMFSDPVRDISSSLFKHSYLNTINTINGFDDKTLQNPCTILCTPQEIPFLKISLLKIPSKLL